METVLGIDVGASELMVARAHGENCELVPGATIGSEVWFSPKGPVAGGVSGVPEETCARWLWLLGRLGHDPGAVSLATLEALSHSEDSQGELSVILSGEGRSPATMAQLSLACVLAEAQRAGMGDEVNTVLTAPAGFDPRQIEALKHAARRAGLKVDRVLADTTAAALGALGADFEGLSVVMHLGPGHSEVALVEVSPGILHVKARVSDPLGGIDTADYRLLEWLFESIERETGEAVSDPRWRCLALAELRMLRGLGFADRALSTPYLDGHGGRPAGSSWELSPGWIRNASKPLTERLIRACRAAFESAGFDPSDADEVVLLSDGSGIDRVREGLDGLFPQGYRVAEPGVGALGAAIHGVGLRGERPLRLIHDETPITLSDPSPEPRRDSARPSEKPPSLPSSPLASSLPTPPSQHPHTPPPSRSSRSLTPFAMPPSAPTVARTGGFKGALTLEEIRAMPLVITPGAGYAPPFHLAYVLIALSNQRDLTGKLTLRSRHETLDIMVYQGGPTLTAAERTRVPRAFHWTDGDYSFAQEPVVPSQLREREPMLTLVASCIKPMLRGFSLEELLNSFGERIEKAPVIAADRHSRVQRLALTQVEARMVEHDFEGKMSLREMIEASPMGRQSLVVLVFTMELFGSLQWLDPVRPAHLQPLALLEREVQKLRRKNHFEVLGAHWSASPALLRETYDRFREEFGPTSHWHRASPELCRQALDLGAQAWVVLSNEPQRLAYRKAMYADIDTELLAPLLSGRAKSLSMRGDTEGVEEMSRLLRELSPVEAQELKRHLAGDTLPGRPSPDAKKR